MGLYANHSSRNLAGKTIFLPHLVCLPGEVITGVGGVTDGIADSYLSGVGGSWSVGCPGWRIGCADAADC